MIRRRKRMTASALKSPLRSPLDSSFLLLMVPPFSIWRGKNESRRNNFVEIWRWAWNQVFVIYFAFQDQIRRRIETQHKLIKGRKPGSKGGDDAVSGGGGVRNKTVDSIYTEQLSNHFRSKDGSIELNKLHKSNSMLWNTQRDSHTHKFRSIDCDDAKIRFKNRLWQTKNRHLK